MRLTGLGPRIIGEEKFAEEQRIRNLGRAANYGTKVMGDKVAQQEEDTSLSVKDLKKELELNPDAFERLVVAELARVSGPRLTACRELLKFEQAREDGPRDEWVSRLEAHV